MPHIVAWSDVTVTVTTGRGKKAVRRTVLNGASGYVCSSDGEKQQGGVVALLGASGSSQCHPS